MVHVLVFYVPETHAESVKEAVFAAGAGRIGDYEACSFETPGTGQFRPLAGSTPFIGSEGDLERVPELRVELTCADHLLAAAVEALRTAHPYEEPAYHHWPVATDGGAGDG
jgi:hypothetical protein